MPSNGGFSLPREILSRVDVRLAVEQELAYTPAYLPPGVLVASLEPRIDEVATLFTGQFRSGIVLEPAEIVQVVKRTRGLRPVSVLSFPARVLYRALTSVLEPTFPGVDRSFERRREIEQAPLEVPGVEYVVLSDVADFYHYVDHRLLVEELIAQSGEALVSDAIGALLRTIMDRDFGVPQVFHSSDFLSEVYIDIAERMLLRQRLASWRMIDDFHIAALTWREAGSALEALDRAVRSIGLSLNERKTRILGSETYEHWLGEPDRRWNELGEEAAVDLRLIGPYGEEADIQIDDEDVWATTAVRALETVVAVADDQDRLQEAVNRQLASVALGALDFIGSSAGVPYCGAILRQEPQLTPQTARYLRTVVRVPGEEGEFPVLDLFESLIADPEGYLSPWQVLWLTEPLRHSEEITDSISRWLAEFVRPLYPDVVRARTALTLAEKDKISAESLAELYNTVRSASKPDVAAGIATVAAEQSPILASITREGPINRWLVDSIRGGA